MKLNLKETTKEDLLFTYGELHQMYVQSNDYFEKRKLLNKMNSINNLLGFPEVKGINILELLKQIGL